ncbi:hypothetical protein Tco_0287598 [Tanacetum coccineum]
MIGGCGYGGEGGDKCHELDVVFDGAFGGVKDEEVVVREGLDEEALVEFMVEWYDEDDDRSGEDDLFNLGGKD